MHLQSRPCWVLKRAWFLKRTRADKHLVSNGRFIYRNVELNAGILTSSGNFNISDKQRVSGRVKVDLRSTAQRLNANLNISGTLKGVILKP